MRNAEFGMRNGRTVQGTMSLGSGFDNLLSYLPPLSGMTQSPLLESCNEG